MYCFHSPVVNTQKTKECEGNQPANPNEVVDVHCRVESQKRESAVDFEAGYQQDE
jgi:uncharacterized protein YqeY